MATLSVDGLKEFEMSLEAIVEGGKSLAKQILEAEAAVVEAKQKSVGRAMGVYDETSGSSIHVINKVTHGKMQSKNNEYRMFVYPQGTRTRGYTESTNSEIGFINEYGKTGQAARPWISTADSQCEEQALDAAGEVFDKFLEENGLV